MSLQQNIDWIEKQYPVKVSKFMKEVLSIMDETFRGLHHTDCMSQWKGTDYCRTRSIIYEYTHGELATYDGSELTRLVILCHERGIRLAISVDQNGKRRNRSLMLLFSNRMGNRSGKLYDRHPTIYQAIRNLK